MTPRLAAPWAAAESYSSSSTDFQLRVLRIIGPTLIVIANESRRKVGPATLLFECCRSESYDLKRLDNPTVQAQTAQVETVSAENSALLSRDQFGMLPIRGRDLTSALRLLPGVQMTADQEAFGGAFGFGGGTGAIQGTRDTQQNLMVDGIVANDMGLPSGLSGQVNMDAVQEVKVMLSNYQAEYSGNPGANISMITRAGTKSLHGSAYMSTYATSSSTPTFRF